MALFSFLKFTVYLACPKERLLKIMEQVHWRKKPAVEQFRTTAKSSSTKEQIV